MLLEAFCQILCLKHKAIGRADDEIARGEVDQFGAERKSGKPTETVREHRGALDLVGRGEGLPFQTGIASAHQVDRGIAGPEDAGFSFADQDTGKRAGAFHHVDVVRESAEEVLMHLAEITADEARQIGLGFQGNGILAEALMNQPMRHGATIGATADAIGDGGKDGGAALVWGKRADQHAIFIGAAGREISLSAAHGVGESGVHRSAGAAEACRVRDASLDRSGAQAGSWRQVQPRIIQLLVAILPALSGASEIRAAKIEERPNVIVLVASGTGWEQAMDWKAGGSRDVLVKLRDGGATLRRFHGNPVAAPGHAELLTGRHFLRNGVSGDTGGEQLLHDLEVTLGEVCAEAGYATGYFGWWRHGSNPPQHPVSQGFSEFAGRCRARWEADRAWIQRGLGPEEPAADAWTEVSAAACGFIENARDRPFLCWVMAPPGDEGLTALNRIASDLLETVEAEGRATRTLTVLVADRPDAAGEAKLFGGPGSLSEGGVRIPGFWHWPGVIEPGLTIHDIAQNVDLFVTLAHLAQARIPDDRSMDGMNLGPLLRNLRPERWPNRDIGNVVISNRNPASARMSFRTTNWLAVRDPETRRNPKLAPGETWELFDLQADPRQLYEVGEEYPFVLARLKSDFGRWYLDAAQFDLEPVGLTVGRPEVSELRLLADYAEPAGPDAWRWHLQTPAKVLVRVDLDAVEMPRTLPGKLRIDGREFAAERRDGGWSFGAVPLPCGRVEAVLEGAGSDFARSGELRLRAIAP